MIRFFDDESSDIPFNTSTRKSLGYNLSIGTIESMDLDFCNKRKFITEAKTLHFIERNWIVVAPFKVMSSWLEKRLDLYDGRVMKITSFDDEVWDNADKIIWYVREPAEKIKSGLDFISHPISSSKFKSSRGRWVPYASTNGITDPWRSGLPYGIGFNESHIIDHIGEPHIMPLFYWLPFDHSLTNIEIDLTRPTFVSSVDYLNAVYSENHPFRWGNQKYNTWEDIFENMEMNFDPVHEYVSMDNVVQWTKENMPELADTYVDKIINSRGISPLKTFDVNKIREQIPNQVRLYESLRKNCHWVS